MNIMKPTSPLMVGDAFDMSATDFLSLLSSDPRVVTVSPVGVVTAIGAGDATVTATGTDGSQEVVEFAVMAVQVESVHIDKLKALLIALGHDVEAEWAILVKLATKL